MTPEQWKNNKEFDKMSHEMNCLFSEWPTPADTVAGFGGNPEKADHRQWQMQGKRGMK